MTKVNCSVPSLKSESTAEHSVGNWYLDTDTGELYVLAYVDAGKINLISTFGNRYSDPVEVGFHKNIIDKLPTLSKNRFRLVEDISIIVNKLGGEK